MLGNESDRALCKVLLENGNLEYMGRVECVFTLMTEVKLV